MNKLVLKLLLLVMVVFFGLWKLSSSVQFQLFGELIYQVIQQRKRGRCCHSPQLFPKDWPVPAHHSECL